MSLVWNDHFKFLTFTFLENKNLVIEYTFLSESTKMLVKVEIVIVCLGANIFNINKGHRIILIHTQTMKSLLHVA